MPNDQHLNDQNRTDFDMPVFARGAIKTENAELRCQVPRRLLEIFDAVSIARDMERFELVIEELSKSADRWMHEASLIHRVTRGNPALSDTAGADFNNPQQRNQR